MEKLEILQYPNELLIQKCQPIEKVTEELKQLALDMGKLMVENNCLGLAAPQIGQLIRLITIKDNDKILYMFNPKILQQSGSCTLNEGCLSFTGQFYDIQRPRNVKVQYRDLNNKVSFGEFTGWTARAVLHEIEHLSGVLFIDKI